MLTRRLVNGVLDQVTRDHWEPDSVWRRRRKVVAGTFVVGSALLERSLAAEPDSKQFYRLTAAVAGTWIAGGAASGSLHLGRELRGGDLKRPVLTPIALGAGAFGGFFAAALVAREIPVLERSISSILNYADEGSSPKVYLTTLANGAAEEVFFRGALYTAVGRRHPVALSTAAYTTTTLATKNPALVLAASVMGTLFGLQRRASGGLLAPLLTHVTWSTLMLRFLPPLFRRRTPLG